MSFDALARAFYRSSVLSRDLAALCSGDLSRIFRRLVNREVGRAIGRATRGLYLRGGRRR